MIFHDVEQNSPEWHALRLGIPTSSAFSKIITPKTMKLSAQAPGYMHHLLAEWMTGQPLELVDEVEEWQGQYMRRGQEKEDEAVSAYETLTDRETTRGGFITDDRGLIGCSPDRLIGDDGDLETKAPLISTQVGYALDGGLSDEYRCQLQGRMLIHGRAWVDIFSYHPALLLPPLRVVRDEAFIKALRTALDSFVDVMLAKREELERRFGPFTRPAPEAEPDHSRDFITDEDAEAILAAQRGER